MNRIKLRIERPVAEYDLIIGHGALQLIGQEIVSRGLGPTVIVVCDEKTQELFWTPLRASLNESGLQPHVVTIPSGARHAKRLEVLKQLCDAFFIHGVDRGSVIVALGGGGVGDVAGFAAATYLRGVPFIQAPTTLLAQVDSAIGGKVGVHHRGVANLIGAYYQPVLVAIDVSLLRSLPDRELRSGLAELVKTFLVGNREAAVRIGQETAETTLLSLYELVSVCCRIKASVVERDELETLGLRWMLNYGHTIGQAIEAASGFEYTHGEAISIGMMGAAHVGAALGIGNQTLLQFQSKTLVNLSLPTKLSRSMFARTHTNDRIARRINELIRRDKKIIGGRANFVVLSDVGVPILVKNIDTVVVENAVRQLLPT